MKHFIANGIVNKLRNNSTKLVFVLEDWLKKALTTLNVPHVDDCCDSDETSRPVKYNKDTEELSYYNNNEWTSLPFGITCVRVYIVNLTASPIDVEYINCNGDAVTQQLAGNFNISLNIKQITNFNPTTMSITFIGIV